MLTISKPLSASQAQAYHQKEFTSESQNYWQQSGAVQGEWQGQLTGKFSLAGGVSALDFAALTQGQHPMTYEQMVQHRETQEYKNAEGSTTKAVEHRAGWDATFSAPKSVSLTTLVGGDYRVREAHRAAVNTALSELERYTQARIGGNNPAETTGKFIAAKFEHDTARPVDGYAAPQLHTHAVIFNVTEMEDGSTRALQPKSLFDTQNYATAVYQAELTYQLRNLGYEIEPGRSGAPEIKGFTQEYLDASSPRSQQIREHLEKTGYQGPAAAQIAAHSTRDSKQILLPEQVLHAHNVIAAEFGNQAERVISEARQRAQIQPVRIDAPERAREAVTYVKQSIFEREAVSDERGIMRDALRRGMGEVPYMQVRAEFDSRQNQGEFVAVSGKKYDSGRSFTTPETIAAERSNVAQMKVGKKAIKPMMTPEKATALARAKDFLNPAQRAVIEEVLTSRDRIYGLQGLAGTGKTTVLESIKEGAEKSGYAVEGFAPTSKATGQLRDAGIRADTLQGFLSRGGQDRIAEDPNSRHLYLLDESSLASTRQMQSFLEKIGPQDRVLVIGDVRQHQGVDAGRPFEQMQDAGMRTAQLDQIMRQKDPELRAAVEHLSRNETETGIKLLQEQGRITQITDPIERIQAIAKDYALRPENTIIVSPDNASRREINQAVRTELQASGAIQKDGRNFTTLVQRSDMTGADRGWAARYQAGDILQYTRGSKEQGIERGSFARVHATNMRENTITVQRGDGQNVTYDPARLKGVSVYREATREIATGDRIQFTAPDRKLGVANRDLGTVEKVEPNRLTVKLDGKKECTVSFDPFRMRHFDHGYAVTSHSSQGLTAGRVLANMDTEAPRSLINTRLAYVAVSRASEDVRIYTNDAGTLGVRLAIDVSKTSAVDFRPPSNVEQLRQAIETLGRNETGRGVEMLQAQGRIRDYADPNHRMAAVAVDYAAQPGRTIVIAPEKAERQELTHLIRTELQQTGILGHDRRSVPVLVEQQGLFAKAVGNYLAGDVIQFRAGSEAHGIARNSSATVVAMEASKNQLTVRKIDGEEVSYNPALLKAATTQSTVYREERREIASGERVQFTATNEELGVRVRDLGTVEKVVDNSALTIRTDKGQIVELDHARARHIEYGYVVDGSRAVAVDRVLLSVHTSPQLTSDGLLYNALFRASQDATVYISERVSIQEVAKVSPQMEQTPLALPEDRLIGPVRNAGRLIEEPFERITTWEEHSRHWTPLNNALAPSEAAQFVWKSETGTIQTYHHIETHRNLHIDGSTGQFHSQDRTPITKEEALLHATPGGHGHNRSESVGQSLEIGIATSRAATEMEYGVGL